MDARPGREPASISTDMGAAEDDVWRRPARPWRLSLILEQAPYLTKRLRPRVGPKYVALVAALVTVVLGALPLSDPIRR